MLFEAIDVVLHRLMKWSHRQYRNALERVCRTEVSPSQFDQWRMNRLYDVYVICKKLYNGHVRRPSWGRSLFLVTVDEVFSRANILKLLFPTVRISVGVKNEDR